MAIDVIIPTMRSREQLAGMVEEIERTAGVEINVIVTGLDASAAVNRNAGLDQATSDVMVMVDDDCERFPQGWVVSLTDVLKDHQQCQMVSARLMTKDGRPGPMMGYYGNHTSGIVRSPERQICTACIAIRKTPVHFFPEFRGSGFEDNAFCRDLISAFPDATFLVHTGLRVVHRNEQKNQGGEFWKHNKALFTERYGVSHMPWL